MTTLAMLEQMTSTAQVLTPASMINGVIEGEEIISPDFNCTPVDPADAGDIQSRYGLAIDVDVPVVMYVSFAMTALKLKRGDTFFVDDVRYVIRGLGRWQDEDRIGYIYETILEEVLGEDND